MKLLKLIPAAAIVLTAFTTFEAKAFKICLYNNAGFDTKLKVLRGDVGGGDQSISKTTNSFMVGQTECIKMGDIPIPEGAGYYVQYQDSYDDSSGGVKWFYCQNSDGTEGHYTSSDEGKTKTYTVSGTTGSHSCKL